MAKVCLITGGAGFIGSNLIRQLTAPGIHVKVLDNLSAGRPEDLAGLEVELIVGDIRDRRVVNQAMKGVETVIHLAAHTNVVESIKHPEINLETNVQGTFNLLEASVGQGVQRFIFASTGGAILGNVSPPVHEEMVPHPLSPYGASKLAGEGYCSAFYGSFGLKTISLRFSNVYGPFSYLKGSVIALFFRQILAGEELSIYGDGEQTRDFVYVTDLCQVIVKTMDAEVPFGQAIQLGTGRETSINRLVSLMRPAVGAKGFPPVRYLPPRPGEVLRNFVSIARAQKVLNFFPQTDLPVGLQETWRWFLEQGGIGGTSLRK